VYTTTSRAAAAPSQLACYGRTAPPAGPFLESPFSGWTEVASFVDHDAPDYSVDGKIVLANGLTATAADGVASDMFPAYWSPALRQYVNYDGHNGYDFEISYQPVLAAAAGTIQFAGWNSPDPYAGYGLMVLINHHNGYVTLYGHLSELKVHAGQRVAAGQVIAISGTTGHSSGPHLHFSVFHNCNVTDPYGWTGRGQDPLRPFDGEESQYLWLPGHDPLLLNPPPGWPAFPLGLKVPIADASVAQRDVPAASRLLLLSLPEPATHGQSSPGEALAATEAVVGQEGRELKPALDDLQQQRLIDSYQIIPAAAAVWVRGIASAQELESLPGVASLAGARPKDLVAAELGLAHSALIQMDLQRAPSLWPVGFRSALQTWRPIVSVVRDAALVAGVALPGQTVTVFLHRGALVPGTASATTDSQSGGFVALLHDLNGAPVRVRPGDRIEVQSSGRTCVIQIVPLSIRARASSIDGRAGGGSTVSLGLVPPAGSSDWSRVTTASPDGKFSVPSVRPLPGGTLATATVRDAAGDQESAATYVPGVDVTLGSSAVTGWALNQHPVLTLIRHARVLVRTRPKVAFGGAFFADLQLNGTPVPLRAGDLLTIGSLHHHRAVAVPDLRAGVDSASRAISVAGPPGAVLSVATTDAGGAASRHAVTLDGSGVAEIAAASSSRVAETVSAELTSAAGDRFDVVGEARGLVLHESSASIGGQLSPGTSASIRVTGRSGRYLGGTVVIGSQPSGRVSAALVTPAGKDLRLKPGMRVVIRSDARVVIASIPALGARLSASRAEIGVWADGNRAVALSTVYANGRVLSSRLALNGAGYGSMFLPVHQLGVVQRTTLRVSLPGGVTVERVIRLAPRLLRLTPRGAGVRCASRGGSHGRCMATESRAR